MNQQNPFSMSQEVQNKGFQQDDFLKFCDMVDMSNFGPFSRIFAVYKELWWLVV